MTTNLFLGLLVYAIVQSVTPGPNNIMLMASTANYGFRRTIPHMVGIVAGLCVMIVLVGVGLATIFEIVPILPDVLTIASALYLLYLAYRIGTAAAPGTAGGTPFTAWQAALFQWVNPKAWVMTIGAITLYTTDHSLGTALIVAAVMGAITPLAMSVWMAAGTQIHRLLQGRGLIVFNWTMAGLLVASLVPAMMG